MMDGCPSVMCIIRTCVCVYVQLVQYLPRRYVLILYKGPGQSLAINTEQVRDCAGWAGGLVAPSTQVTPRRTQLAKPCGNRGSLGGGRWADRYMSPAHGIPTTCPHTWIAPSGARNASAWVRHQKWADLCTQF